jgi:hypothetical protein
MKVKEILTEVIFEFRKIPIKKQVKNNQIKIINDF